MGFQPFDVVDCHVVAEIPVKTVGLFNKDNSDTCFLQLTDHLAELLPTLPLGRLGVRKLFRHLEPVLDGVFSEKFELGLDGETFLRLLS